MRSLRSPRKRVSPSRIGDRVRAPAPTVTSAIHRAAHREQVTSLLMLQELALDDELLDRTSIVPPAPINPADDNHLAPRPCRCFPSTKESLQC